MLLLYVASLACMMACRDAPASLARPLRRPQEAASSGAHAFWDYTKFALEDGGETWRYRLQQGQLYYDFRRHAIALTEAMLAGRTAADPGVSVPVGRVRMHGVALGFIPADGSLQGDVLSATADCGSVDVLHGLMVHLIGAYGPPGEGFMTDALLCHASNGARVGGGDTSSVGGISKAYAFGAELVRDFCNWLSLGAGDDKEVCAIPPQPEWVSTRHFD